MQNHLYFICPTDNLETVINKCFKGKNYYCTSLGNSVLFDSNSVGQLNDLLITKDIGEISFVLSSDNRIILDAIGKQAHSDIAGLNQLYNQIKKQKKLLELLWQDYDFCASILSCHLNQQIGELQLVLKNSFFGHITINGKIYNRRKNLFEDTHPHLVCRESFCLN